MTEAWVRLTDSPRRSSERATSPVRVLIADDSPAERQLLRHILEGRGGCAVVAEAENGTDAVLLATENGPDVAILDIAMPMMDGLEAAAEIRRGTPGTRLVILSAYSSNRMADQALAAGADAYVEKSSPDEMLLETIHRLCPRDTRNVVALPSAGLTSTGALARAGHTLSDPDLLQHFLFDALEEGVVVVGEDGLVQSANFSAASILGIPTSRLIGRGVEGWGLVRISEDGTPVPDEGTLGPIATAISTGRPQSGITLGLVRHDCPRKWLLANVRPLLRPGEAGPHAAIASLIDITDRQRASVRFQGLLESAPDAIVCVDPQGRIALLNAQAERLFGYDRDELIGQAIEILVPESVRVAHPGYRSAYFGDPRPRPMGRKGLQLVARRRDGSEFPADISLNAMETEEGILVSAAVRDVTERRKIQAKFEGLLQAAPDAMLGVLPDGSIAFVNHQAERLFGYEQSELLGQPVEVLVPERVREVHPSHRVRYFANPQVRPMGAGLDLSGRRKDGSEFPAEISLSSIETEEGVLVTAAVRDITERRKIQAKFEGLLQAAPDAMLGVLPDGTIAFVNHQAERLFGYEQSELLGQPVEVLVPERVREVHPSHRVRYFANPQVRPMGAGLDLSGRRKDGSEFPAEISLSSIETEEGILVTAAVRDLSERSFRELLSLLIESVVDYAIIVLDPQGNVLSWNPGAQRIYGYTSDEILGHHFSVLYLEEDVIAGKPNQELATALARGRVEDEGWRERKDGSHYWVNAVISTLRDRDGNLLGFAKVTRDLTARRHVLALERSNHELEQFATVISHDLSQPLRVIRGFAQILEERMADRLNEDDRASLGHIIAAATRGRQLINDLLTYASVSSSSTADRPVDLSAVVNDCLEDLATTITEAGATVEVKDLPVVHADPTLMRQLFQNLIGNAVKFSDPRRGPAVTVSAHREDGVWRISVSDNGLGVPLEQRERIFGMFTRLQNQADYPGTGLGLAICKRIVEQRGGRIWVEANADQGSVFWFTLPDPVSDRVTSVGGSPGVHRRPDR